MTHIPRRVLSAFPWLIAATSLAALAAFGPLSPPPGAVTPTAKPLAEIEPRTAVNAANTPGDSDSLFKITQPGSYYLTGNVTGVAAKHGVEIAASGVTLDLNGFDLIGVAGSLDGVSLTLGTQYGICVRNGSVRSWGDEGVDLGSFVGSNCTVSGVRARANGGNGITVSSNGAISDCAASGNGASGISAGTGASITACSAENNGTHGIVTQNGGTVNACAATGNVANGISVANGGSVTACSAWNNGGHGISTSGACAVTGCGSFLNTLSGVSTGTASTVSGCATRSNTGDGFLVSSNCTVVNCTAYQSAAGVHATGDGNRLEGNNCNACTQGVRVDGAGNIIIRNACHGNVTDWQIATGNTCLVVAATVTTAPIAGISGGVSPGSTNPNANFTY